MTTEDDFQRALDANPDDWQTRLVLADFLQELGDERAEGYRALGLLRRVPADGESYRLRWKVSDMWTPSYRTAHPTTLPEDWWREAHIHTRCEAGVRNPFLKGSRRECEDAAARAFALLSPSRHAELLSTALDTTTH